MTEQDIAKLAKSAAKYTPDPSLDYPGAARWPAVAHYLGNNLPLPGGPYIPSEVAGKICPILVRELTSAEPAEVAEMTAKLLGAHTADCVPAALQALRKRQAHRRAHRLRRSREAVPLENAILIVCAELTRRDLPGATSMIAYLRALAH